MDTQAILAACDSAESAIEQVRLLVTAPPPSTVRVVRAGENLQAALDAGGDIELEAGAQFAGSYLPKSHSIIIGKPGSAIRGATAPAVMVAPGTTDIHCVGFETTSGHNEAFRVGENDATQTRIEDAPSNITLTQIRIPQHRGKRGFSINGKDVTLVNCQALNVWDEAGQDSQAVYIGNAPGGISLIGGRYSAGSEVFLSGGGATAIPGLIPDGILLDGVELFRPISWQTDGVSRKVKNIFELKNGRNVVVRNTSLSGCWAQGQAGEAIMLTPATDGAKLTPPIRSGEVSNVLFEDCTISNVGSVANLLGRHYSAYTVNALSGVVFRRVKATVSRALFGGRGQLAILAGEPADVLFDDCTIVQDGSSLLYYDPGTIIDPVTLQKRIGGKLGSLTVKGSRMTMPVYGVMLGGVANALRWQDSCGALEISGNVFGGSFGMRAGWPQNEWLDRAAFDARLAQ